MDELLYCKELPHEFPPQQRTPLCKSGFESIHLLSAVFLVPAQLLHIVGAYSKCWREERKEL